MPVQGWFGQTLPTRPWLTVGNGWPISLSTPNPRLTTYCVWINPCFAGQSRARHPAPAATQRACATAQCVLKTKRFRFFLQGPPAEWEVPVVAFSQLPRDALTSSTITALLPFLCVFVKENAWLRPEPQPTCFRASGSWPTAKLSATRIKQFRMASVIGKTENVYWFYSVNIMEKKLRAHAQEQGAPGRARKENKGTNQGQLHPGGIQLHPDAVHEHEHELDTGLGEGVMLGVGEGVEVTATHVA